MSDRFCIYLRRARPKSSRYGDRVIILRLGQPRPSSSVIYAVQSGAQGASVGFQKVPVHAVSEYVGFIPLHGRCHMSRKPPPPCSLRQGLKKQGTRGSLLNLHSEFVGLISDPPLSDDAHVVYAGRQING